jgi:formylglycine-generating enzyme required for sulfatase activity
MNKNQPVTNIDWLNIIVWCNALSEMIGLDPVYRTDSGIIFRSVFDLSNYDGYPSVVMTNNNGYRLPTLLEWEMAARWRNTGGSGSTFVGGRYWTPGNYVSGSSTPVIGYAYEPFIGSDARNFAWYGGSSNDNHTRNVGLLQPNHLGIYDMSGNILEMIFVFDRLYPSYKGGFYSCDPFDIQIATIWMNVSTVYDFIFGFRLVRGQ